MSPYISGAVMDGPVALLLVLANGRRNAATISCFSELAHHPTSLWVSIATGSYTHDLVLQAGAFTLAVLSDRQRQIALACGSVSGRDQDKVATLAVHASPSGLLAVDGALASSLCRVRERIALNDHTVFLADIVEGVMDSRASRRRHLLLSDL
ncbi:MAG TPA: flavin reductase family protein [Gemmatimonadaceae bacterium]|nr:flavin reductase family protein [Gemmatimonadaceae bacterium]